MTLPMARSGRFAGQTCEREPSARVIRVGEVPGSNPGAPIETSPFAGILGRLGWMVIDPHDT
jgi:hypothetical protein